ncbi:uncharacterized protein LOC106994926 isoform X2 [Macaca mulatta]
MGSSAANCGFESMAAPVPDFRKPESPPSSALLGPHLSPQGRHEGHREKPESAANSLEALKKSSGRSADRTQEPGYPRPES